MAPPWPKMPLRPAGPVRMAAKGRRFRACRQTRSPLTARCVLVTRPAVRHQMAHQTTVGPLGSPEPIFQNSAAERALAIPSDVRWLEEALQTTVGALGSPEPIFQNSAAERAPAIPN